MARAAHVASEENKRQVERMAAVGITQEQIAAVIGISQDTLVKYYGDTIRTAAIKANANVGGKLYQTAMNGNVTAMIFWMKTRGGWREVQHIEHQVEMQYVVEAPKVAKSTEVWLQTLAQ
jgi:hypothetical protein